MKLPGTYRHELKYPSTPRTTMRCANGLSSFMKRDFHTGKDGFYTVHSIYFDNADDKALREKSTVCRSGKKFRVRYYNEDFSFISLEKKIKYDNLCMKLDAQISKDEYLALLSGEAEWMKSHPSELVRELYCKLKYNSCGRG